MAQKSAAYHKRQFKVISYEIVMHCYVHCLMQESALCAKTQQKSKQ